MCLMVLMVKSQSTSGYKGTFVGGAVFTGINFQNWAGSKTATATPFYQVNAGFSFQSKTGVLVDFIPIALSYNDSKFITTSGLLVRYYFKN